MQAIRGCRKDRRLISVENFVPGYGTASLFHFGSLRRCDLRRTPVIRLQPHRTALSTNIHQTRRRGLSGQAHDPGCSRLSVWRAKPVYENGPLRFQATLTTDASCVEHTSPWRHESVEVEYNAGSTLDIYTYVPDEEKSDRAPSIADASTKLLGALQLDQDLAFKQSTPAPSRDNYIVYLPRGPFPGHDQTTDENFARFLEACETNLQRQRQGQGPNQRLTVIKLNYELSPATYDTDAMEDQSRYPFRYPLPVTQVCWSIDHITDRYEEAFQQGATFSIYGENFGGSLALMHALTGWPDVHAIAVLDPTTDWTGLDEIVQFDRDSTGFGAAEVDPAGHGESSGDRQTIPLPRRKGRNIVKEKSKIAFRSAQARAANRLIDLRTSLFHNPSGFFDPFASPLLFLRAPGRDTPLWRTAKPEAEDQAVNASANDAYGPYDDDWSTRPGTHFDEGHETSKLEDKSQLDTVAEAIGADAVAFAPNSSVDSHGEMQSPHSSLDPQKATSGADQDEESPQDWASAMTARVVKRRKVLYRWPSVGFAEEAVLPYVKILSTKPAAIDPDATPSTSDVDYATVLSPQAKELADVMKRACFWGRPSSVAEERVVFEEVERRTTDEDPGISSAVAWIFDKSKEPVNMKERSWSM